MEVSLRDGAADDLLKNAAVSVQRRTGREVIYNRLPIDKIG
jgi:hypothetical protein